MLFPYTLLRKLQYTKFLRQSQGKSDRFIASLSPCIFRQCKLNVDLRKFQPAFTNYN